MAPGTEESYPRQEKRSREAHAQHQRNKPGQASSSAKICCYNKEMNKKKKKFVRTRKKLLVDVISTIFV